MASRTTDLPLNAQVNHLTIGNVPTLDTVSGGSRVTLNAPKIVVRRVSLAAAASGTGVTVIPDSEVGAGRRIISLLAVYGAVGGATAWTAGTAAANWRLRLADNNDLTVWFAQWGVNAIGANGQFTLDQTANITYGARLINANGLTDGRGIRLIGVDNSDNTANAAGAGSDITITVIALIA